MKTGHLRIRPAGSTLTRLAISPPQYIRTLGIRTLDIRTPATASGQDLPHAPMFCYVNDKLTLYVCLDSPMRQGRVDREAL